MTVERANLLNVCKLVVKELIDSSLSQGRMLDDDHVPLQQFFVVLEHVMRHGIKRESPKALFFSTRYIRTHKNYSLFLVTMPTI